MTTLPRSTPESQGVASSHISAFIDDINRNIRDLHSLMLVRHGAVIAEGWWQPYQADAPHVLFSLSKSFTSSAIGLAIAEGRLDLRDRVLDYFPDDAPATINEHLAEMRVEHLLSMTSGHHEDTLFSMFSQPDGNWARGFLGQAVTHAPGSYFVYNSGATYMLSAILQRLTGQTLLDYLRPRLLAPLGIEGATWDVCPRGVNVGGWGMKIKTEDITRFGQLYLQRGYWQGQQVLPEAWVAQATAFQSDNNNGTQTNPDWQQGYGYQFWRCRHGAYRGDGAFGQFCVVFPDQDAVLAITSGLADMQAVLNLVWQHLLPAFAAAPLPENAAEQAALQQRLSALCVPMTAGVAGDNLAHQVSGKTYHLESNALGLTALQVQFGMPDVVLHLSDATGSHDIVIGGAAWRHSHSRFEIRNPRFGASNPSALHHIATSGAWVTPNTYSLQLCFAETPFIHTFSLRFEGERVQLTHRENVSFMPIEPMQVWGQVM